MHVKVIAILFLTSFNLSAYSQQGQESIKWCPVGTTWWYQIKPDASQAASTWLKMISVKDTIIGFDTIHKLTLEASYKEFQAFRIIHDDILVKQSDHQLFYLMGGEQFLLYDFSKDAGDTLVVRAPSQLINSLYTLSLWDTLVIDTIDQVVINGVQRRRQFLRSISFAQSDYGHEVIEGIGAVDTWFFPTFTAFAEDIDVFDGLRCFQSNDGAIFNFTLNLCDHDHTTSIIYISGLQSFVLAPNPAKDRVSFQDVHEFTNRTPFSISIHDSNGIRWEHMTGLTHLNGLSIDLHDLVSGLYFVRVFDHERIYSITRIIKL